MERKSEQRLVRYDLRQAAEKLGFSPLTLRRKVKNGEIAHYRPTPGGKIMFTDEHLRDFEQRRTFEV